MGEQNSKYTGEDHVENGGTNDVRCMAKFVYNCVYVCITCFVCICSVFACLCTCVCVCAMCVT